MQVDKSGNLIHEDFHGQFQYGGTSFIVDKMDYGFLITQSNFIINAKGETLEEAKNNIKDYWDKVKHKYQSE